ncbi:MAG: hypothetical protein ACI9U0_002368 [Flavobacteriales bacterium]|jgi:hypothetical protein
MDLKRVLTIGTFNHLFFLIVIPFGCAFSGFQCSGASFGLLLTLYGFTIFPFVVCIELAVLIKLLVLMVKGHAKEVSYKLIIFFSSTLLLSLFVVTTL